jgi:hypothetical protein
MGRPPSTIRNVRRVFTLSPDDALKLKALAASLERSEAAVVRKLVREAAKKLD